MNTRVQNIALIFLVLERAVFVLLICAKDGATSARSPAWFCLKASLHLDTKLFTFTHTSHAYNQYL